MRFIFEDFKKAEKAAVKNLFDEEDIENYLECEAILHEFFEELNYCTDCFTSCCNRKNQYQGGDFLQNLIGSNFHKKRVEEFGEPVQDSKVCGYLGENGCVLERYKNPTCISYVCDELNNYLSSMGIEYNWYEVGARMTDVLFGTMSGEELNSFKSGLKELLNKL